MWPQPSFDVIGELNPQRWVNFPRAGKALPTANVIPFSDVILARPARSKCAKRRPERSQQTASTETTGLLDHLVGAGEQ